jgi:RsiW-degrading membrane proteinase PrsW (M82 family)
MLTNIFAFTGALTVLLFWWGLQTQFPADAAIELDLKLVIFAIIGGVLPALLWLWFWLKQDAKKPEPRSLILLSFMGGMVAVPFVIPLEQAAMTMSDNEDVVIFLWALIEESVKFFIIYLIAFKSKFFDEPIDALIYLITGALGFSALENTLYLINVIIQDGITLGALNMNLRFLGATILHVVSSASVGLAIAFSFYMHKHYRKLFVIIGIVGATALHTVFNLFIIDTSTISETLLVFSYYWFIVVVLILLFERVKIIKDPRTHKSIIILK